jgi:hypothetical protein
VFVLLVALSDQRDRFAELSGKEVSMRPRRELVTLSGKRQERTAEQSKAAEGSMFDYPATQIGVAGNVTVSYDPSLGAPGLSLGQALLSSVVAPYNEMEAFFGIPGGAVSVIIVPLSANNDGTGGGIHSGCDFATGGVLYLDATFGRPSNALEFEIGLYVAELSECFMGVQNAGWVCNYSNGEGLSRYLAEIETAVGTLDFFATGNTWALAEFPNWIDETEDTDQDPVSIGCAIVYLYWMRRWLGFTTAQIVQAGGTTLAANYKSLTGKDTAYIDLKAAVLPLQPQDNPFDPRSNTWLAAVAWTSNRLDIFGTGTDNAGYHNWWDGAAWGGWEFLGGKFAGNPTVASWAPNRLDVFARGTDGALYHLWWDGNAWGAWESLGGAILSDPVAVAYAEGRLDIFALGTDSAVWHQWWDGTSWGGWESLGGVISSRLAVVSWGPNRLDVFGRGTDGALYHLAWDGNAWGGWERLGGSFTSDPAVAACGPDRLDVFARGQDLALYHKYWNGGAWSDWESLGGVLGSSPNVVSWGVNRLDVFATADYGAVLHCSWDGVSWQWTTIDALIDSNPLAVSWAPGRIDLFGIASDTSVHHNSLAGGAWTGWEVLGGSFIGFPSR